MVRKCPVILALIRQYYRFRWVHKCTITLAVRKRTITLALTGQGDRFRWALVVGIDGSREGKSPGPLPARGA